MADPKNPRAGEVWERDGKQRVVVLPQIPWFPLQHVTYRIGNREYTALKYVWRRWAKKATCIKEAADG